MQTFAGIDSSSRTHLVQIIDEKQDCRETFEVPNSQAGFAELTEKLRGHGTTMVGIELTHGPVIEHLQSDFTIYPVNPLQIRRFKDIYCVSGDKTDMVDALAIARYVAQNQSRLRPLVLSTPEVEKLRVLGISHDRMVQERARIANRMRFIFRQYYPLLDRLFSAVARPIVANFVLRFPQWEVLQNASSDEIVSFLHENKYRVRRNVEATLRKISAHEQCISEATTLPLSMEAQTLARMFLVLFAETKKVEKEMQRIVDAHPLGATLASLPGCGDLTAAKLLGLLGDNPERFSSAAGFQALMGTAPTNYQSGSYHRVSMRRACNKRGRAILFQFAFSSMLRSPWARGYYDAQRKRGKTHSVAVRALSNKWAKIIFLLWKNREVYREEKRTLPGAA